MASVGVDDREYVRWAYRLLLGREPESEAVVENNPFLGNRKALVESFVTSEEFLGANSVTINGWASIFPVFPALRDADKAFIKERHDPVRDWTISLALETIKREGVPGAMAELGVYRGDAAVLYNRLLPDRSLYLFDTFEGFPERDLRLGEDDRFRDTSVDYVRSRFPDGSPVIFRQGYFPDTARGLEEERFCFVMLDADMYDPTLAGLEFFYDRVERGGYIFAHDYTSGESDRAVSRAFDRFLSDKPEKVIEIPDVWGSVAFRKV
jgi:O-methyltransferase